MKCEIIWNTLEPQAWQERFGRIRRANLLQSYAYARAVCPLYRQKARWGLITLDGEEAGLVQLREAGILGNLLHGVILDRGPLWFDTYGSAAHIQAFFRKFDDMFPRRFGRRRRILPELEDGPAARGIFDTLGYERLARPGYETVWLDLGPDLDTLRRQLGQKWRNALNKAEKADLTMEWDTSLKLFSWLLPRYEADKAAKGFRGPDARLLKALAQSFTADEALLTGRALRDGVPVAGVMILCHGTGATYQIGWTGRKGRDNAAHNLCLWESVKTLKSRGVRDFDLGGINKDTAAGVKRFKQGLGGKNLTTVGHYL